MRLGSAPTGTVLAAPPGGATRGAPVGEDVLAGRSAVPLLRASGGQDWSTMRNMSAVWNAGTRWPGFWLGTLPGSPRRLFGTSAFPIIPDLLARSTSTSTRPAPPRRAPRETTTAVS